MCNEWQCEVPSCDRTAVGTGGAIGLRAIGWYFEPNLGLFCPSHRPDGSTKRIAQVPCDQAGPCSGCKADEEADRLQYLIAQTLELSDIYYTKKMADRWNV